MLKQFKFEVIKLAKSKMVALSFITVVAFVVLMLWGFYSYAERKMGAEATAQFKYTYESRSYFNGLTFALYSLIFSFSLLIPILVAMIAGAQIAGERSTGTLRMLCMRPVSRLSIFFSKFLTVCLYTYALVSFFIVLNLLVGLLFVGWGNLELYPGPLNLVDEPGTITRDEALLRFVYASFSATWSLLVIAAVAMLFSTLFETSTMSTVAAVSLYLMLYIIGRVEFFEHLRPYFFTTDMDAWRDVFKPEIPWQSFYHYSSICGIYILGILLAAITVFERKDITS